MIILDYVEWRQAVVTQMIVEQATERDVPTVAALGGAFAAPCI